MTREYEATVGRRGQVVIPEPVRDAFDLRPGTTVTIGVEGDRVVVEAATNVLDGYLAAIPKRPEPETVDWDEEFHDRLDD